MAKVELRISSALIAQVQAFVVELKRWTDAASESPLAAAAKVCSD